MNKKLYLFLIFCLLIDMIILSSCKKKKDDPQPQPAYKSGYSHQVQIIGSSTSDAGLPTEQNQIYILNNSGADINLKDYTIKEKVNSWTIAGDSIIIKSAEQYTQPCSSINPGYDELKLYNANNLIQTYNQ